MEPGTAGLGLNFAAEGRFKAGEAASILGTTSAVIFQKFFPLFKNFLTSQLVQNQRLKCNYEHCGLRGVALTLTLFGQ